MRTTGKGPIAGNELYVLLDLPKSPQKYFKYHKVLQTALKCGAEKSGMRATMEAVQVKDGCTNLVVEIDVSWQRRGFKSLNRLMSVTSSDTGKVVDVSILSKYCQICSLLWKNWGACVYKNL